MINKYEFNMVWWDGVEKVMYNFPKMFRVFIIKQTPESCGANRQLSRVDDLVKNVCPSCGK